MTDRYSARRRHPAAAWVPALVLIATSAGGVRGSEKMLATDRWQDLAYGLSIRPPIGAIKTPWPIGTIRMRFLGSGGYTIDLFVRSKRERNKDAIDPSAFIVAHTDTVVDEFHWQINTGEGDVTLERVETIAQKAMELVDPTAVMIDRTDLKPDGRAASVVYFKLSPRGTSSQKKTVGDWVLGQAFMELKRNTFVVLRLQVDHAVFQNIRPIFEAMVRSIRLEDRRQLGIRRKQWIDRGRMWLELLDRKRLHQPAQTEQYFRIKRDKTDIGYIRLRRRDAREMQMPGIGIEIVASVNRSDKVYESQTQMFLSTDGEHEIWSIKTQARPLGPAGRAVAASGQGEMARQETGVRSRDMIEITRDGPMGPMTRSWSRPPHAYISQVELQLIEPLLPRRQRQRMAFYAYHPDTGRVTMHTIRIVPTRDGTYQVYSRASLDHPDVISTYGPDGNLIHRNLPGGIVVEPATPQQIKRIWIDTGWSAAPQK